LRDRSVSSDFECVARWLSKEKGLRVFVERAVSSKEFPQFEAFDALKDCAIIDFIVVLGGDGTLLYSASLFQGQLAVPPIVAFARGSLGFLTPFQFKNHRQILETLTSPSEPHWVSIRMRLRAKVFRPTADDHIENVNALQTHESESECGGVSDDGAESLDAECAQSEGKEAESASIYDVDSGLDDGFQCVFDSQGLNEVLIERKGSVTTMILLGLHVDRKRVTNVRADGLIIHSPTGSTAYSVSAGGSLIAPNVPCIGLTPICPHTLSFRPVVVADSSVIHVVVHQKTRALPKITVDGKFPFDLRPNDIVQIEASKYPVPTFKLQPFQQEWWGGLVQKLKWNGNVGDLSE